jgi:SSS family solute:Na+ symporter
MAKFIFLGLFIVLMIAVGIYSRKKVTDMDDFLLGGRKMGPWITAFAYGTTYFSAVIFIGYAGRIGWNFGIASTWIGIANALIGGLLAWLVLAKRTRKMTHELNATTMPEFFEKRYDSKIMKIVTASIIFIFLVPYTASVYQGLGYLFEKAFNIPFVYCMMAMAILTGIYLMLGGYVATAMNNFIQGIIMIVGIVLMLYFIISHPAVGGLQEGVSKLKSIDPNLAKPFSGSPLDLFSLITLTSLGTWGLPQMVHKFYSIRDDDAIKKGTIITTFLLVFLAELGDKTQLSTMLLASKSKSIWYVFIGSALALTLSSLIGVLAGSIINKFIPQSYIQVCSGIVFVIIGLLLILGKI